MTVGSCLEPLGTFSSRYCLSGAVGIGTRDVETTGDANKTSSGIIKFVEPGQHSMQTSLPMNQNTTVAVSHNEKSSKFTGQNFKTWQQKMLFYLTMLNLAKYLNEDSPVVTIGDGEGEVDDLTAFSITQAWEQGLVGSTGPQIQG
ncbi:hypothetical protein V6N11_031909 [Hibiscus sabdariffa]|uniref:Retrotransposon Copia-like N-terminal domain-containing protein n=1 Tax=Hibiscus sabdariffa TaxID=183260 RepID=A0ABR2SZ03_9ROSI